MSFFPEPPDPAEAEHQDRQPVWAAPPDDVVPVTVPIDLTLGRSGTAVVQLTGVRGVPHRTADRPRRAGTSPRPAPGPCR